ncbi:hypothetical protein D9758_018914 [Tetrapyrgos nigripes]|uniref:protein S-acyltransferase n=1 Tax=Tetrapyrgos nigripes TaxID=182062 RepID=A0A8H5FD27_9AGAR|nr:hypothetical protein D9758_018914 [Tetrapyrgos nigripes]
MSLPSTIIRKMKRGIDNVTEQNKRKRQVLTDTGPVASAAENNMSLDGQVPQGSNIAAGRDLHMYNVQGNQNQTISNDYSQTVNSHNNIYDNRYIQTGGSNTFVTLDAIVENIKKWINAPDPSANYNAAYENMTKGTGMWLLNHPKLLDWKMNGGLLWLQGKEMNIIYFSTNVITSLKTEGHTVFYFYFDTLDQTKVKGTYKGLLSSIMLSTGIKFNQTTLQNLYQQYDSGTIQMHADAMKATLLQLLEQHSSAIYIVMDALDECQAQDHHSISSIIHDLLKVDSKIHILVSCRHAASAIGVSSVTDTISLDEQVVKSDIQRHIEQVFQERPLSVNVHKEVTEALVNGAHGQIRWVDCQIQQLQELATRKAILYALKNLPEDLEETYVKALLRTKKGHQKDVQAILRWLLFGYTQLTLKLLPEILRIDFEGKKLEAAERIEVNGVSKIIDSTLVIVVQEDINWRNEVIRHTLKLAHPSVKEYILSDQIKSSSAAHFHVNDQLAHEFIAQSCMIYLVVFGEDKSLYEQLPLLNYAANIWPKHVNNLQQLKDPIKSLSLRLLTNKKWLRVLSRSSDSAFPFCLPTNMVLLLQEEGTCINTQGGEYGNALQAALFMGNKNLVWLLLEKGADVNAQGGEYGTPLQVASLNGYEEIVKLLLKRGADVNAQSGEHGNALQAALVKGNKNLVRLLLEGGADVNAQGGQYGTPLQAASFKGYAEIVKLLLGKGADVNIQGGKYGNALQTAIHMDNGNIVRLLLEKGADVHAQCGPCGNALQAALYNGNEDIARVLIERGADVNAQYGEYGTPLEAASYKGYQDTVRLLLAKGADVNGNALHAAVYWGYKDIVKLFLEKGADANAQDCVYRTPLQVASFEGYEEIVKLLLEKGADANSQGLEHALQTAVYRGYENIVKLLLEKGANINSQSGIYGNALQTALYHGHKDIVRLLLEKGAELHAPGGEYSTPLQAALYKLCASRLDSFHIIKPM